MPERIYFNQIPFGIPEEPLDPCGHWSLEPTYTPPDPPLEIPGVRLTIGHVLQQAAAFQLFLTSLNGRGWTICASFDPFSAQAAKALDHLRRKAEVPYAYLEDYEEEEEWLDLSEIPELERVVVLREYSSDDDSESAQADEDLSALPPWHPFNLFK